MNAKTFQTIERLKAMAAGGAPFEVDQALMTDIVDAVMHCDIEVKYMYTVNSMSEDRITELKAERNKLARKLARAEVELDMVTRREIG